MCEGGTGGIGRVSSTRVHIKKNIDIAHLLNPCNSNTNDLVVPTGVFLHGSSNDVPGHDRCSPSLDAALIIVKCG